MDRDVLKWIFIICLLFTANSTLHANNQSFENLLSLTSTNTWKEYCVQQRKQTGKDKWVWISSITFKSKEALKLRKIKIQWEGQYIDKLSAALFVKKRREVCVVPIEKNLICDGIWDKKRQQIIFYVNEKIVAMNKYHLVLSFPGNIENLLKKGKFTLSKQNLRKFPSQNN